MKGSRIGFGSDENGRGALESPLDWRWRQSAFGILVFMDFSAVHSVSAGDGAQTPESPAMRHFVWQEAPKSLSRESDASTRGQNAET
jgi:hypothetical protein